MAKVWITTYALSAGIQERELVDHGSSMCTFKLDGGLNGVGYAHGKDWHLSHTQAILRAIDMRDAKIKSLRKKIKELESRVFP